MKKRKNLNIWLPMLMFLLAMISTATAEIIFVDTDANGVNDGSSWADAYNYLQKALSTAVSGDEIRVAQGIYRPNQGMVAIPDFNWRTTTFQLINGVAIMGGYAGFGEPDPNARDIELYETILSGDLLGNDGQDFANNYENSYHVVTGSGTDGTAVLDGFTITAGNANGLYENRKGGGMYNNSGSPTVTNCTFSRNSGDWHGGGMCNTNSSPTVTNCTFSGNSAGAGGGGMFNQSSSSPMVTNCAFSGNSAWNGGGICSDYDSSSTIINCTISDNLARYASGIQCCGDRLTILNCTISDNTAYDFGGGIYFGAGPGPHPPPPTFMSSGPRGSSTNNNPKITNCILWANFPQQILDRDGIASVTYSDVQGGWPGIGNIDADPCFVEPGCWVDANDPNIVVEPNDPNAMWVDGDYHLLEDSPCIDAGDPNYIAEPNETDLDGKPRIIGGRIDMGAYEYSPAIPAEVRIVPRTINLASKGKWITSLFWLPNDYNIADIEPNSVFLEDEIQAESFSVDEQQQVAIAKFSREEVQNILEPGEVELTVSGELTDGTVFEGTNVIRVIDKGGKK